MKKRVTAPKETKEVRRGLATPAPHDTLLSPKVRRLDKLLTSTIEPQKYTVNYVRSPAYP